MGNKQISQELIDKYGEENLRGGLAAADHKRQEYVFNHPSAIGFSHGNQYMGGNGTVTPLSDKREGILPIAINLPEAIPDLDPLPQPTNVKIWPLVMLAAIRNKRGGAARLWFLAKSLDPEGSGKVGKAALFEHLASLKVGSRKRRRWLRNALDLGLMSEKVYRNGETVYKLVKWGRGFGTLGCQKAQVGRPAEVQSSALVRPGWRARVWAAYETTLEGRVISQEKKCELTGIAPRTQRNYLSALNVKKIQNYSKTDILPEHVEGARDALDLHLFINKKTNKVVQRHPNIIVIPSDIARSLPKGRSRKAQSTVNAHTLGENSLIMQRVKTFGVRLYHESRKGANKAIKKLEREDQPGEVFWCQRPGKVANQWGKLTAGMEL